MIENINEIKLKLGDFQGDVEEILDNSIRKIALDVDQNLVLGTPVDTGRAKANWQTSINILKNNQIDWDKSTAGAAEQRAIQEAQTVLAQMPKFPVVWIQNNLDYIERLNDGSSTQAPSGFVDTAVEAANI
jgi:hypothetical protein